MPNSNIASNRQHMQKRFRILNRFNRNNPDAHNDWHLKNVQSLLQDQAQVAAIRLIAVVASELDRYHDWLQHPMPSTKRIRCIRELRAELKSALELVL